MTQDYMLGTYFSGERYIPGAYPEFPLLWHIVNDLKPQGFALEFGVAEGTSLKIIAAHMPAVGFDSFQGLPEAWCGYPAGSRKCRPPAIANTRLVIGWFADTLPLFDFATVEPIGLVHIDCDLFSSTKTVLEHVGPHLKLGTIICFDEWHGDFPGVEAHEQRAWREFAERTDVNWTVVGHDHEAWAIQITHVP